MNVLSLSNEFAEESFGGAGTAVTGMLDMFDRLGVRQTVIVPKSGWQTPGWEVRGLGMRILGLPRNSQYFAQLGLVNAEKVCREFPELKQEWDLIHCHAINFAPLTYMLAQRRIPILYSVYSFLRQEFGNRPESEMQAQFKIQEELLLRCQRIHLISHSERNFLASLFPHCLTKAQVIPLGISWPDDSWQSLASNNFVYVGRLLDYKGIEDLILALSLLRQSGRQVHLTIVGKASDPAYESRLRKLVYARGLGSRVEFRGWLPGPELRHLLKGMAGLVVPSRREAFGLVALEGMALGIPIISSRAGGLSELVFDSWGLTFEPNNIKQLAEALGKAVDHPALLQSLAVKGRAHAAEFEWGKLAHNYMKLLERIKS